MDTLFIPSSSRSGESRKRVGAAHPVILGQFFSCTRFNASKPSTCHISDNYGYCWRLFSAFRRRCVTGSRGYHSKIGVNFPVAPASAVELGSKDVITVDFRSADFVNAVAKKDRLGTDRSPARNYLTKSLVLGLSTPTLQKCCGPRRHF